MTKDSYHRKLIASYYEDVEMPGGYYFNQPETLKMVDRMYNSKFKTGQYDPQGFRKFFYNIVKPTCDIATKFIDLDTRDILLTPEHVNDELRVFLAQRRLKQWLKDVDFGVLLNEITQDWPAKGHVVIKKSKDGWKLVPLQNIRNNPAASGLVSEDFAELYVMSHDELVDMGWMTDELSDRGHMEEYVIYDCFTKSKKGWKREVKADLWSKRRPGGGMVRSVESEINHRGEDWVGSICIYEEELKNHNYRELAWERVPGRALGRGYVEYLEDNQIARNETENLERKAHAFHSTPLLQTRDEEVAGKNALANYQPGDIIRSSSEINPVANEARNLPQFTETRQNWDANTERKTFTSDITTGASLPSRTPLGVANLQASLASSYFERKREELGLFIKRLLLDDILPSFAKDTAKEHTMVFSCADEESQYLDDAITNAIIGDEIIKYTEKTGFWPSAEQKELLRLQVQDKLKGKKNRFLKIPEGFWKNAKYMVDINITGESTDVSVKSQLIQLVLQIAGTNPMALQDPNSKNLIFKLLSLGGISPVELGLTYQTQAQPQMQPQVAGSLARPTSMTGSMTSTQQI